MDIEGAAHELSQGAFEHDQEGDAEQAEGHAPAEVEVIGLKEQDLGDPEQRQDDQEEAVVQSIAIGLAVADQGGEQQGDDAGNEQVGGDQEQRVRPSGAEAHGKTFEQPGGGEQDQGGAVIAADADPVFAGGQQEAPEHGPAEAEEHFVGMPLDRRKAWRRCRHDPLEYHDPDDRQAEPGEAGEDEKWPEADQPEGVGAGEHVAQQWVRRAHSRTGGRASP